MTAGSGGSSGNSDLACLAANMPSRYVRPSEGSLKEEEEEEEWKE